MNRSTWPSLVAAAAILAGCAGCGTLVQGDLADSDLGLPQHNPGPENPPTVSFDVGSFDRYVWRGLILTDGPVLQPGLTVGRGPLSVNVWGNMDLDDVNGNGGQFNELDITLAWEKRLGKCDLSVGVINYNFPNTPAVTTTELYVGAGFDVPAQPAVKIFFDVAETNGTYLTLDAAHAFSSEYDDPVGWKLTLSTGIGWGSAEHNSLYFGADTDGATDFHVGLAFAVTIDGKWTLSQNIVYTSVVDDQLRDMVVKDGYAAYGMSLTVEF